MQSKKRNIEAVEQAGKDLQSYPDNYVTCWMCWMQLTDQDLSDWRIEPYSDNERHGSLCPLCGYAGWTGRRWYPFLFLRTQEIGNPSCRIRPTIRARRRIY